MENQIINTMGDLVDYFDAESPADLNRRIYKDTACGASISVCLKGDWFPNEWVPNGDGRWRELTRDTPICAFTIHTIVEGSDATVDSPPFVLPVDAMEVKRWIDYMEAEAHSLWIEANTYCYVCGEYLFTDEEIGRLLCHGCIGTTE